jgi:hypothetical protein
LNETVFRHTFAEEELKKHELPLEPEIVIALWPSEIGWGLEKTATPWSCLLPDGASVVMRPEMLGSTRSGLSIWGIRGEPAFWAWLERQNVRAGDALIFKIEDMPNRQCRVTFTPRAERDESLVARRNSALADVAYAACKPRRSGIYLTDLVAKVIALGIYHGPCPPDSVESVVNNDSRFMWDRDQIKLYCRRSQTFILNRSCNERGMPLQPHVRIAYNREHLHSSPSSQGEVPDAPDAIHPR